MAMVPVSSFLSGGPKRRSRVPRGNTAPGPGGLRKFTQPNVPDDLGLGYFGQGKLADTDRAMAIATATTRINDAKRFTRLPSFKGSWQGRTVADATCGLNSQSSRLLTSALSG